MKALVTGANGFVGAALCKKLIDEGCEVRGLVRKTSDLSLLEGVDVEKVFGSIAPPDSLAEAVQGVQIVYHVAAAVSDWGTLEYFRKVNVDGTKTLMNVSEQAGVERFVFVSSVAVHSFIGAQEMDESSPQLPTPYPYCQSKREAEQAVLEAHMRSGMSTVIVRPGDVYGPGDRTSLLKMADLLEKGRMASIAGGKTLGAFTYVENLADGIVLAGKNESAEGAFILTDGVRLTWKEYFDKLTSALDLPAPRISVPTFLAWIIAGVLETAWRLFRIRSRPPLTRYLVDHLSKDFHFSISKANRILGFRPSIEVDEAVRRTAVWYRQVVRGVKIS